MKPIKKILFVNTVETERTEYDSDPRHFTDIIHPQSNVKMESCGNKFILPANVDAVLVPRDMFNLFMQGNALLDKIQEGVIILDDANTIVWSNKQFQNWFCTDGLPNRQQDFLDFLGSPVFLGKSHEELNPMTTTRKSHTHSKSVFRLDDKRYFEMNVYPYGLSGDQHLLIFLLDITQQKQEQNKLVSLHSADLEISQMRSSEILEMDSEERMDIVKDNILRIARTLLEYEMLELRTYDPVTQSLSLFLQYGMTPQAQQRVVTIGEENGGINAWVAEHHESYLCKDCSQDPYYLPGGIDACSSLTLPIMLEDELLGVLNVESTRVSAFDEMDILIMEIFVRGIAVTMNTLRVLEEEKQNTLQTSAEKFHGQVALPVDNILSAAIQMSDLLSGNTTDMKSEIQLHLYNLIKNIREVKKVVREIGKTLTTGSATSVEVELGEKLRGKRILLVDSDEEVLGKGNDLLSRYGCEVDLARTGQDALGLIRFSLRYDSPYYAILTAIEKIPDFPKGTKFIMQMGELYGEKHPPFVLLQQIGMYNPEHTIVNTRMRYPASQIAGKPFTGYLLLEAIHRAAQRSSETAPVLLAPLPRPAENSEGA
ncbi:MAG: GAF domain-containing protein [Planctomycetia bacterium]|nr:GAF domain-containing protein [Planctomycetia bacterium]